VQLTEGEGQEKRVGRKIQNQTEHPFKDRFAAIRRCSLNNSVKYGLSPFVHRRSLQKYQAFVPDFNFDMNVDGEDKDTVRMLNKQEVVDLVKRKSLEPHALQGALALLLHQTTPKHLRDDSSADEEHDEKPKSERLEKKTGRYLNGSKNPPSYGTKVQSLEGETLVKAPVMKRRDSTLPELTPRKSVAADAVPRISMGVQRRGVDSAVGSSALSVFQPAPRNVSGKSSAQRRSTRNL
jgi:hypothetical protein